MVDGSRLSNDIPNTDLHVPDRLSVGVVLTTDARMTRGRLEQFCLALGDATGIQVAPHGVSSYSVLSAQLSSDNVDVVWLPPVTALHATATGAVRPIVLPIRNGQTSYGAALFAREDARWRAIDDLEGVRVAWVDPQSASGYLVVRAHLEQLGVDLGNAFSEDLFAGSHDAVVDAVRSGRADVGATFVYVDEAGHFQRAGWGASNEMHIIAQAGPIPNDILAARRGLNTLLVRLVQSALVDVHDAALRNAACLLLTADGFVVPTSTHLEPLSTLFQDPDQARHQPHSMFPRAKPPEESP